MHLRIEYAKPAAQPVAKPNRRPVLRPAPSQLPPSRPSLPSVKTPDASRSPAKAPSSFVPGLPQLIVPTPRLRAAACPP